MTVGDRIKERRKQLGLSQKELADKAGLRQATISAAETGKNNPSSETIQVIAQALGIRHSDLLGEIAEQSHIQITEEEMQLIAAWRAADEIGREDAMNLLIRHAVKARKAEAAS